MAVTTELVLIRHGETDWNKEHRLQGQAKPGPPLNDMGFQQTHMVSSSTRHGQQQQQQQPQQQCLKSTLTAAWCRCEQQLQKSPFSKAGSASRILPFSPARISTCTLVDVPSMPIPPQ
jgi:bisphosphoglycerate-dependent phosphoglycerate mutase